MKRQLFRFVYLWLFFSSWFTLSSVFYLQNYIQVLNAKLQWKIKSKAYVSGTIFNKKLLHVRNYHSLLTCSLYFSISPASGMMHSLSWHRKGERTSGCKLYARVWMPEDPRTNSKLFNSKYQFASDETQIWFKCR